MVIYELAGHTWAHHCCAAWSEGVIQAEDYSLLNVDKAVFNGLLQVGILRHNLFRLQHNPHTFCYIYWTCSTYNILINNYTSDIVQCSTEQIYRP